MSTALNRPEGLTDLSERVYDVLARYTTFPWPVLKTQCDRIGLDPFHLTAEHLGSQLVDNLAASIARFTGLAKGAQARDELLALLQAPSHRRSLTVRPSREETPDHVEEAGHRVSASFRPPRDEKSEAEPSQRVPSVRPVRDDPGDLEAPSQRAPLSWRMR